MIIDTQVQINVNPYNAKHFKDRGYDIPHRYCNKRKRLVQLRKPIIVKIADLMPTSTIKVRVKCEDCKKERYVQYGNLNSKGREFLKTGETPCNACATQRRSGENHQAWVGGGKFTTYKNTALRRGYVFELTLDQLNKLINSNCLYCGKDGGGIDRYDNTIGYTINNSVPCCRPCNLSKHAQTPEAFINNIIALYHNLNNKGLIINDKFNKGFKDEISIN